MPIYELVRFSTAAQHVGTRLTNMQRAWDEYLQQFDPCRCAPCRHNGIPFFKGTSCKCICKSGYQGGACEETLRRGETVVANLTYLSLNKDKELPCQHLSSSVIKFDFTQQTLRQMGRGHAGVRGHSVHLGQNLAPEPVIILHLMGAELPVSVPPLRTKDVETRNVKSELSASCTLLA